MSRLRWPLIGLAFAVVGVLLAVVLNRIGSLQATDDASIRERAEMRADLDAAEQLDLVQSALIEELQRRCRRATECQPVNVPEVIDNLDPDDPELDQPEIQEREIQERERQDPEDPDAEPNDADPDDPETQDDEVQDGEIDDPDPNDPEQQDPEIDDPDPNDPPVCDGEFVCQAELDAILADYATRSWVIALLQALGCQISGVGSELLTCTITGKP